MRRGYKIEAAVVTTIISIGTAILVYQFYFNRNFLYGQARFLFENRRYDEAIPKYLSFLSRFDDGEYVEQAQKELTVCTYHRIADLDKRLVGIERQLDAIAEALASRYKDEATILARKVLPAVRVLAEKTHAPIQDVYVTITDGASGKTDANGIFNDTKDSLQKGGEVQLSHPGYETQKEKDYKVDSTGLVTFTMRRGGDASLLIKASLTVRGEKSNLHCYVTLLRSIDPREKLRETQHSRKSVVHFAGLAPGEYFIEARFYEALVTYRETVQLEEGQRKVVEIEAKTDESPRIQIAGVLLSKRDGNPLPGVQVHVGYYGSGGPATKEDGTFSTTADRYSLQQVDFSFGGRPFCTASIDGHISEDMAKKLVFHLDPLSQHDGRGVGDKDGDGVFCDGKDCVICQKPRRR